MKCMAFASRNIKELLRDPLSWIFCLGFPIVMLLIMSAINESIPPESGMTLFQIEKLTPGISVFGLTFIMLFASLLISGDRKDSFLIRVFASPMKPADYILGYILPLILLAAAQSAITVIIGAVLGKMTGNEINLVNGFLSILISLPAVLMFVGFGLLFGTLLSPNAAPGISSVIITFSGMLGGIWMDTDAIGGTLLKICNALPFLHAVKAARFSFAGNFEEGLIESGIVMIWAVVILALSILVFRRKMRS